MSRKYALLAVLMAAIMFSFVRPLSHNDFDIIKNIEIFTKAYRLVNSHYAEEIDPNALMKVGIDAMMESLDPYTVYYSESDVEKFRYQRQDARVGLGATLGLVDGKITIINALESSPAIQSGLRIGDQIVELEGKKVKDRTPTEFQELFETYPGDFVNIGVLRSGVSDIETIRFERNSVAPPRNVPHSQLIDGDIGYVILTTFTAAASANIKKAIIDLKEENPELKGIILDLRDNGGGLLHEAVNISNLFLPAGKVVVSTRGKIEEDDKILNTTKAPYDPDIPLTVLINGNSASASEIVSGVIQDYDRGVLIGRQSYGKGLVQNFQDVAYNARLKITISKYYIPSGRCIQSVQYRNGEPVNIPDSLRSTFYTSNGRSVLDGGGVRPDIVMPEIKKTEYIQALEGQQMIHKYVNFYTQNQDSINNLTEYRFSDMSDFYSFVDSKGFEYKLKLDEAVESVDEVYEYYTAEYLDNLSNLSQAIKEQHKKNDEEYLRRTIETEIIKRQFFRKGEIQKTLDSDPYIAEAVRILNNPSEYNEILNTQK